MHVPERLNIRSETNTRAALTCQFAILYRPDGSGGRDHVENLEHSPSPGANTPWLSAKRTDRRHTRSARQECLRRPCRHRVIEDW